MRISKIFVFCLVLVLAVSALCVAAEKNANWWGKAPGVNPDVRGTIASVDASSIGIQTKDGVKTFAINQETTVVIHGKKAAITDLKAGVVAIVRFKLAENNTPVAIGIRVPNPQVKGKIAAIEGNVITIRGKDTANRVTITPETKYGSRGYKGTLADLKIGYVITASGAADGNNYVAKTIEFVPMMAKGTVTAVEGNLISVKTIRQAVIQGQVSDATYILIRPRIAKNKKGTLADVKPGMPVNIGFHANANGPVQLLWVNLLTGE